MDIYIFGFAYKNSNLTELLVIIGYTPVKPSSYFITFNTQNLKVSRFTVAGAVIIR